MFIIRKVKLYLEALYVLRLIRKWLWLIVLACLVSGAAGLVVSLLRPKVYEADAMVYLNSPNRSDSSAIVGAQQAAKAFALIPQSGPVLLATIQAVGDRNLSPAQLSSMLTVVNNLDTQFVTIGIRDSDPRRAARLATVIVHQSITRFNTAATGGNQTNSFMKQELDTLAFEIKSLENQLTQKGQVSQTVSQLNVSLNEKRTLYSQLLVSYESMSTIQAVVLQDAEVPKDPVGGGAIVGGAIGMLAGLIVITGVILFIERPGGLLPSSTKRTQPVSSPIQCPRCNFSLIPPQAVFCPRCGNYLGDIATVALIKPSLSNGNTGHASLYNQALATGDPSKPSKHSKEKRAGD